MASRSLTAITALVGTILVNCTALALPATEESCSKKGLCTYVSPTGRVTCGKCPGQVIQVPVGAIALCTDDTWSMRKARFGACVGHGRVKVYVGS
jgi:hypothetical protein